MLIFYTRHVDMYVLCDILLFSVHQQVAVVVTEPDSDQVEDISAPSTEPQVEPIEAGSTEP